MGVSSTWPPHRRVQGNDLCRCWTSVTINNEATRKLSTPLRITQCRSNPSLPAMGGQEKDLGLGSH